MHIIEYINYFFQYKIRENCDERYIRIAEKHMDNGVFCMLENDTNNNDKYIVYSAGIGDQINFELELLDRLEGKSVELFAFDPTPKSLAFLEQMKLPDIFHVYPYAISAKDEMLEFALPKADGWVSGSAEDVKQDSRQLDFDNRIQVEGRTIKSIMDELGHVRIDFLKMDIEGSEFSVFDSVFGEKLEIKQICLDYHEHMFKNGRKKLKCLLKQFEENGYKIYWVDNKQRCIGLVKR